MTVIVMIVARATVAVVVEAPAVFVVAHQVLALERIGGGSRIHFR
jgi:hypothetical protein